jgi:hypothetical protein
MKFTGIESVGDELNPWGENPKRFEDEEWYGDFIEKLEGQVESQNPPRFLLNNQPDPKSHTEIK